MIPKKVHLAWKDKDLLNSTSPLITEGMQKLVDLNPEWQVEINTDDDIDAYLKHHLDESLYAIAKQWHPVQKTDLWRLIKMYAEGGVYTDIDRFCDTPLDSLTDDTTKWVLPVCRDYDFSHDFMMTAPNNPVYKVAIDLYLQRIVEGHTNIYFLGAQTYMHAITYALLGEMVNTDPGKDVFAEIRRRLESTGFIKIYVEDPPYHTVMYRGGDNGLDWEHEKRQFYKQSGLRHWSNEW